MSNPQVRYRQSAEPAPPVTGSPHALNSTDDPRPATEGTLVANRTPQVD